MDRSATKSSRSIGFWVIVVFAGSLVYQFLHWIEHVAQVYQHWWLGISVLDSHGILFFFDLEWNHYVFNTLYFLGLTVVLAGIIRYYGFNSHWTSPSSMMIYAAIIQSYHQFEHTVKIIQHMGAGCEPCPGIAGLYLDLVYLHFTLNSLTLILPLIVFFRLGYHAVLKNYAASKQ